jgi:hypothetical protein
VSASAAANSAANARKLKEKDVLESTVETFA